MQTRRLHITTQAAQTCIIDVHAHFLSAFVVVPAAYVAVTEAICLWHFALFLSSPHQIADRFYSS